ncbi:response regulator [Neolewinella aurantiaca]|uniref:histidine kinase n=1 Tax=Neolewinella aurantiaca TaxID=2602767 RepID=A0A5C7FPM9_9BACT|nr:ATP-binding protein [Neolewinella aurantiaca]TXF89678.1 response regulator [Neolewinella aurantiaca]
MYPEESDWAAYELLPCGVAWTDEKQKVTYVNKLLRELLGYTSEELVGERYFYELLSVGGKLYFEAHFAPALALEGELRETNFEMVGKTGARHPVIVNVSRLLSAGGGYIYVAFPSRERQEYERELKRARLQAETADKTKSTFISTMSHEIRTPLHAILEAGNFLFKDDPRPDQLEFIQVLRSAGNSLLNIVNDILDVSKLEAGMTTLDERPMYGDQLVKQVVDTYRPTCKEKGVVLRSVLPIGNVPLLLADGGKLTQVLNNLVSNAVKFTSEGEIVISLTHEEDEDGLHNLSFRVRDTGMGIAEDQMKYIFEPFVQASEKTQADFGGTGLGLAICKRILEAYGADLKINSKPGEGTEFYFTITLKAASAEELPIDQRPGLPAEGLPPLNHIRVLNVDDVRSNLLINARYFSEWKLLYDQATSGKEALKLLETNTYDVVLLDLKMPGMDGYELARRIRSHPDAPIKDLPLIALSASASQEVTAQMLEAGINGLVIKPFEPGYLHHIIKRFGEQEGEGNPEQQTGQPATETRAVDFSRVQEIFEGDEEEYLAFLRIIKDDVAEAKDILGACKFSFSQKEFGDLKHNLISTMRVFLLDELAKAFDEGKTALETDNQSQFLVVIDQLLVGFDVFEGELLRALEAK